MLIRIRKIIFRRLRSAQTSKIFKYSLFIN
nr:MAG TPA: hypothetical protein [Caudoviricetes sp.]